MKKVVVILVAMLGLVGCGMNKAVIAERAQGPREIFVNLRNDPLLISIELKTMLEAKGYRIALSTEEASRAVVKASGDSNVIYKNVSESPYRYELILAYQPIQDRVELIAASLRDREHNKILGTYRWTWDRLLPAPTIEGAIDRIDENLLSRVFR